MNQSYKKYFFKSLFSLEPLQKLLAINWTNGVHNSLRNFNWKKDKSEPTEEDYLKQPDVVKKWQNTKEFHEKICWACFPDVNPSGSIHPTRRFR